MTALAACLIPWRPAPGRAALLAFVVARLEEAGLSVMVGELPYDAPWSKGEALARARLQALDADVIVAHDADSYLASPETLLEAVRLCADGAAWVVPHRRVGRWPREQTALLLRGEEPEPRLRFQPALPGGGVVAARAEVWDDVGGVDPRFVGWGGEDRALGWALETLHGPPHRLPDTLFHLWHPPATATRGRCEEPASGRLTRAYRDARGSEPAMRLLLARGPIPEPPPGRRGGWATKRRK